MKLDITVIILTLNEALHIARCLENVNQIARKVYVIDCHSSDGTQDIACRMGAEVIEHDWPGNQAEQFNWALDNLPIETEWILRLDADEYLSDGLIAELKDILPTMPQDISALVMPLGRAFMGRVLHHGIVNGISMVRAFRKGRARYERREMDEHLQIENGDMYICQNKFVDDNRMPLSHFINKHNGYATREATVLLSEEYGITANGAEKYLASAVQKKRQQKGWYSRMPLFWRAGGYFFYRYVVKCGFLDGKEGFLWDFLQGWWYRTLVDAKIFEIKRACGNDKEKIRRHLIEHYNIKL